MTGLAAQPQARPSLLSLRQKKITSRIVVYFLLILIAAIIIIPLAWMVSTSFKPKSEWFMPQIYWIPRTFTLQNYQSIFNSPALPMVRWFANSLLVATSVTVLVLVVDSLAGYAYARMKFRGRNVIFGLLLVTMFLPGMMFLIPNFLTVNALGWLNSYAGLIAPALAGVFGVFFMRQFFLSLPKELEEAAYIDGATRLQTFRYIALPLARPALATLGIITFLASWNDFLWPLLVLRDRNLLTLPPGLSTLQGAYTSEYGQMMAGAVITALPVLLLYIVLQRYIVESVQTTGLKG